MEPSPPSAFALRRGGEAGTGGVMEPKRVAAAEDRLSSLPAELRDEILVRLDLRDAVRTSVLSRAWRHLWKSLSVLSLSFPSGTHPSVVDSVVLPYIGPRVSLFDRSVYFNLHSSIFSFGYLVFLWLRRCNIPPLPVGFAGFPALQDLYLSCVRFPANGENQLEAIIRRSPLLHVLRLYDVLFPPDDRSESVIEAPNLRRLRIYSVTDCGWRVGELPCLEDAYIEVDLCRRRQHGFGDFLARLAHVEKLSLYLPSTNVEIPYTLPFTFSNLKILKLCMDFSEMHPILFMFTLLRSCHNLENLEMEFNEFVDQSFEGNWEFLNALWSDGMCANLQTVRMIHVNWLPKQISFMKLILSKASLLRTLYVDKCPDVFDDAKN